MQPAELLRHHDDGSLWAGGAGLDVREAYARALEVRKLRVARGERPRGYKVGFTNRLIWPRYGVYGPIWGTVYASTLAFCEGEGTVALAATAQPRLEPECVFGLAATPPRDCTLDELRASIEWLAPGFEIVQSHLAGWKFTAADTVADGALHARLLVGARIPAARLPREAAAFDAALAAGSVVLRKGTEQVDAGRGANVLDGPLHALHHFLRELRDCPGAPDLQAGDVVTTGTWTDAWPVAPGESWTADFEAPLAPLKIHFT